MYVPQAFAEPDVPTLHRLLRAHPLGALVTLTPQGLDANHISFVVHAGPLPHGTLHGHVARTNPVWREAAHDTQALVIFQGPERYITPSWYPGKRDHGKVVPTWNYAVVHAHGPLRVRDDPAWTRPHLEELVRTHEAAREAPWQLSDAPADFLDAMVAAVVGLEIPIARLVGKWKVSQNRPGPDREGVIQGLTGDGDAAALAMADLVRQRHEARG
jgi:transcriptional regulator